VNRPYLNRWTPQGFRKRRNVVREALKCKIILSDALPCLDQLFSRDHPIAVLAGAGVSLNSPSNLLAGGPFMEETLRRVFPSDLDTVWAKSIRHAEGRFVRPGEFLRFEVLMAGLVDSGLDVELRVLDCLAASDKPNANHFALASLIHAGCVVMTTNFDTLIEQAYAALAFDGGPLRVIYRDEDFPTAGPGAGAPATLWKLHGSLDRSADATRQSVQATMTSVLALPMIGRKRAFLRTVLQTFDLVALGYSGSDDLDLIPILAETSSAKRLIWVSHDGSATQPRIRDGRTLIRSCTATWPQDIGGWRRLLFTPDDESQPVRPFENILEVTAATADVVTMLSRVYGCPSPPDTAGDEHRFGSRYPEIVSRYFDDWFARLPPQATVRYELVETLAESRACRADDQRKLDALRSRLRSLRRGWRATPHDRLYDLMNVFNEGEGQRSTLLGIRRALARLPADLSVRDDLERSRLEACVAWCLDGTTTGEEAFRRAAGRARKLSDPVSEFHTLVTWRDLAGYSQWSDLYPEFMDSRVRDQFSDAQIDRVRLEARRQTGEAFPDDENRRLLLLADSTGRLPVLWRFQTDAVREIVDPHPVSRLALFYNVRRVLQFCVDVGDVTGEVRSEWTLARLYMGAGDYAASTLHLLRTLELGRIVTVESISNEASDLLKFCEFSLRSEYVDDLRLAVQRSMWGETVDS
jgi:hypothetical protein